MDKEEKQIRDELYRKAFHDAERTRLDNIVSMSHWSLIKAVYDTTERLNTEWILRDNREFKYKQQEKKLKDMECELEVLRYENRMQRDLIKEMKDGTQV